MLNFVSFNSIILLCDAKIKYIEPDKEMLYWKIRVYAFYMPKLFVVTVPAMRMKLQQTVSQVGKRAVL